jgi:hypothetical protein
MAGFLLSGASLEAIRQLRVVRDRNLGSHCGRRLGRTGELRPVEQGLSDLIGDPIVRITMLADGVDDKEVSAILQKATREGRRKTIGED